MPVRGEGGKGDFLGLLVNCWKGDAAFGFVALGGEGKKHTEEIRTCVLIR